MSQVARCWGRSGLEMSLGPSRSESVFQHRVCRAEAGAGSRAEALAEQSAHQISVSRLVSWSEQVQWQQLQAKAIRGCDWVRMSWKPRIDASPHQFVAKGSISSDH